ncbi:MAG TPA: alpha/beta fold hydrolase [Usitatibacter sp.]|jgi:pimeloyl-ACP methyl ester carboxylesterase|nr:alpha/beta fold hydrolase [Usitatibacter sp.]
MGRASQQIRFCRSRDGTRIAYATCGEGPPLVRSGITFSHLELEWDCITWRHWLELFSRGRTLIRYDMRGTGLSDRDCAEFNFERYLEDFEAVVEAAGLARFDLVGLTGGGGVAVTHAARHPEQVDRMVLYASYVRGRTVRSTTPEQREETELLLKLIEIGWGQDNPLFRQLFTYQFLPDGTTEHFHAMNELMRHSASASVAARLLRGWFASEVSEAAARVRCPTLVMHARHDMRMPFEEGRALAALIPGARFMPIDTRNNVLLEHEAGWTAFVREFEDFLGKPAGAAGSIDGLTARESSVLEVLARGLDTEAMAVRLGMSEKTLRNHLSTIFSKLGVSNRTQAILHARARGFGQEAKPES